MEFIVKTHTGRMFSFHLLDLSLSILISMPLFDPPRVPELPGNFLSFCSTFSERGSNNRAMA